MLRLILAVALIGMFIYNVQDVTSNHVGKIAKHYQQIETALNQ